MKYESEISHDGSDSNANITYVTLIYVKHITKNIEIQIIKIIIKALFHQYRNLNHRWDDISWIGIGKLSIRHHSHLWPEDSQVWKSHLPGQAFHNLWSNGRKYCHAWGRLGYYIDHRAHEPHKWINLIKLHAMDIYIHSLNRFKSLS